MIQDGKAIRTVLYRTLAQYSTVRMALPSYKSANKADLSFYYWARPKILDSTASLGGSSWVSTQRQTALRPIPPSDYKLPFGEKTVRTEPSRMGGDSPIDLI